MLKQGNEKGLSAVHVSVFHVGEDRFNGLEFSRTSEFVEQSSVGRVIVFETQFLVAVKEGQGIFWVFNLFDLGDERNALAKL